MNEVKTLLTKGNLRVRFSGFIGSSKSADNISNGVYDVCLALQRVLKALPIFLSRESRAFLQCLSWPYVGPRYSVKAH